MPNPKALVIEDVQSVTLNLNNARTFGPVGVAAGVFAINVQLSVESWPANGETDISLELSLDGGQTFPAELKVPIQTVRPPFIGKDGLEHPATLTWSIMDPTNPNRMVRAQTVTRNGPIHTTAKIQAQSDV